MSGFDTWLPLQSGQLYSGITSAGIGPITIYGGTMNAKKRRRIRRACMRRGAPSVDFVSIEYSKRQWFDVNNPDHVALVERTHAELLTAAAPSSPSAPPADPPSAASTNQD